MMQQFRDSDLAGNLLWLLVSVILATGVWYIAVTSADPIHSRRFERVPIQFIPSDTTVLTNDPTSSVAVSLRGSQSVVSSRRSDDIVVRADLTLLGAGTHNVPLQVKIAQPETDTIRRLVAETQPSQIIVDLEPVEALNKPISISVVNPPPIGFRNDDPETEIFEVQVSGASSIVSEVVEIRGDVDLSSFRSPVDLDIRLYAVDADGRKVNDIALDQPTATVSVYISRRDDVRQIAVRPNILVRTLPIGYTLKTSSYDPERLFISGAPDQLADISDTLFTAPISLEDRQSDFSVTVPVQLPGDDLFVMGGDNIITVSIEILPITTSRQIDSIDVGYIGLAEGHVVSIVPQNVSAIVNGPVSLVNTLASDDLQVFVDLNSLAAGVYDVEPEIAINRGELSEDNVSLQPEELNVEITAPETTPEAETVIEETNVPPAGN